MIPFRTRQSDVVSSLIEIVSIFSDRLGLNSSNSSKPPSSDPNRVRRSRTTKGKRRRKPGGQKGHIGSRLEPVANPSVIEELLNDRRTLPPGKWQSAGFDKRQVFDVEVAFSVTEYQAEILKNESGETFFAEFPDGVTEPAQYGIGVKSTSVYLSQFQLIPQARVQDVLKTQYDLPIAKGSVNNFNILAARTLRDWSFEDWLRGQLVSSPVLHVDETGTNLNGVRHWIHCLCNESLTYFHVDSRRGQDAMERMGVLANFQGQLVHLSESSLLSLFEPGGLGLLIFSVFEPKIRRANFLIESFFFSSSKLIHKNANKTLITTPFDFSLRELDLISRIKSSNSPSLISMREGSCFLS
jgi:transposase